MIEGVLTSWLRSRAHLGGDELTNSHGELVDKNRNREYQLPEPFANAKFGDPGVRIYVQSLSGQLQLTPTFFLLSLAIWGAAASGSRIFGRYDRVKEVLEAVGATASQVAISMATLQSVAEAERQLLPQLARRGWLISMGARWDEPANLLGVYSRGGFPAVEDHLMNRLSDDTCRNIVQSLARRPSFAPWQGVFIKALAAQERGDPELAIPIWLIALDGIVEAEIGLADIYSKKPEIRRRAVEARLLPGQSFRPIADAWLNVLAGLSRPARRQSSALISRHAVFHGDRPVIGSRRDSVQCIVALEVLHHLLAVADSAKAAGANFGLATPLHRPSTRAPRDGRKSGP